MNIKIIFLNIVLEFVPFEMFKGVNKTPTKIFFDLSQRNIDHIILYDGSKKNFCGYLA